ncbi:hypothetical protein, partial [Streptococcus suis]|uniref:hypothetical protein n=1 Tax=Streptococcus suis TaxID=1307 RepID=UPI00240F5F17
MTTTIDFEKYTAEQLEDLMTRAAQARAEKIESAHAEKNEIKSALANNITKLQELLGEETNPKADTIRGLRNFTPEDYELFKDTTLPMMIDAFEQLTLRCIDALKVAK